MLIQTYDSYPEISAVGRMKATMHMCDGQSSVYKKRKLSIVMGQNLSCLFPGTFHIILYEHEQEGKGDMCENEIMSDLYPDGCSNPL
jgi:hypothetical protein